MSHQKTIRTILSRTVVSFLAPAVAASALALVGCGEPSNSPPALPRPFRMETAVASTLPKPEPKPADDAEEVVEVVYSNDLGDAGAGKAVYQSNCASCHGATGASDGPMAATLDPRPSRHNDGGYMNTLTNDHLFEVIRGGGVAVGKSALMAPWGGVLSEEQIADVAAFVRSLAEPPYQGS